MPGGPLRRIFLLCFFLQPTSGPANDAVIHCLQVAGTRRPVQLASRAGEVFDPARVERDVRRLWSTGWFQDIQVESSDTPRGVHLTFALVEKPRLYLRRVEFWPGSERRPIDMPKGMPLDGAVAARVAGALRLAAILSLPNP